MTSPLCRRLGVRPGFNTRNCTCLVERLRAWGIATRDLVILAPFNAIGFQMTPSREASESTLSSVADAEVIAFSLLAAGHIGLDEAVRYARSLPNLRGVAVGTSRVEQAREVFRSFAALSPAATR